MNRSFLKFLWKTKFFFYYVMRCFSPVTVFIYLFIYFTHSHRGILPSDILLWSGFMVALINTVPVPSTTVESWHKRAWLLSLSTIDLACLVIVFVLFPSITWRQFFLSFDISCKHYSSISNSEFFCLESWIIAHLKGRCTILRLPCNLVP